jgi:peptidoglycan hydrolase-like protein with peptidoglycan-binding domain
VKDRIMTQNKFVFPALMLTGILGLTAGPGWTQTKPGGSSGPTSPGTTQQDEGTTGMKRGSQTQPGAKGMEPGDRTSTSSTSSAGGQWGKDDIKKVQEALKDKGQDPGPADGVMGAQTQKALRAFQSANGLKASGRLDEETAKKLGVEKGSSSAEKGSSSMKGSSSKESSSTPAAKEPSTSSKNK